MDNWRDLPALHGLLRSACENWPDDDRHARFVDMLKERLRFTEAQAELYASTVLSQNAERSADDVRTNGLRLTGSWIWRDQQGNVGSWLSTVTETWRFDIDLTYEHKIERYDSSITTGPFFQSSYSGPKVSVQRGIWAPADTRLDELKLFAMSTDGFFRSITVEWIEKETYNNRTCSIEGKRFIRE
jgi:hypothetical protein